MSTATIAHNSWVLVCDGAKALILRNKGDQELLNLVPVEIFSGHPTADAGSRNGPPGPRLPVARRRAKLDAGNGLARRGRSDVSGAGRRKIEWLGAPERYRERGSCRPAARAWNPAEAIGSLDTCSSSHRSGQGSGKVSNSGDRALSLGVALAKCIIAERTREAAML